MSFLEPTLLELAIHEAGHAYAFASLVRLEEPIEMGLSVDSKGRSRGWCRRRTLLHRSMLLANVPDDVRPHIRWQAAAEIVIAMAGPVAEFRHRHRSRAAAAMVAHANVETFLGPDAFDVDGDFQRVRDTLEYLGEGDPVAALRRMVDVTEEIVAHNWPAIGRLGRELLGRRLLGEDPLIDWFGRNPARRWNDPLPL